jgi:hypothetical protein
MLVEADLMIVFAVLACNGTCLPVHLLVKVEQILGHQMQEMCQARSIDNVLVSDHTKGELLAFDVSGARALNTLGDCSEIGKRWRGSGSAHDVLLCVVCVVV